MNAERIAKKSKQDACDSEMAGLSLKQIINLLYLINKKVNFYSSKNIGVFSQLAGNPIKSILTVGYLFNKHFKSLINPI